MCWTLQKKACKNSNKRKLLYLCVYWITQNKKKLFRLKNEHVKFSLFVCNWTISWCFNVKKKNAIEKKIFEKKNDIRA